MVDISLDIIEQMPIELSVGISSDCDIELHGIDVDGLRPEYRGAYVVTPNTETQILPTANRTMGQNVVVNPIPSNYGLITWNGSVLTVS